MVFLHKTPPKGSAVLLWGVSSGRMNLLQIILWSAVITQPLRAWWACKKEGQGACGDEAKASRFGDYLLRVQFLFFLASGNILLFLSFPLDIRY